MIPSLTLRNEYLLLLLDLLALPLLWFLLVLLSSLGGVSQGSLIQVSMQNRVILNCFRTSSENEVRLKIIREKIYLVTL